MNRRQPPRRRTPLRAKTPKARTPKRLPYRSPKMRRLYATQRRDLVAEFLEAHPICQRCRCKRSTDVHEIRSRARGGSITDEANLAALCRGCHDHVTQNPAEATAEGWLKHSWED